MQKKRSQHVHKIELRIKTTLLGLSVDASTPSPLVCCLRCLSVPCPSWGSWLSLAGWSLPKNLFANEKVVKTKL